MHQNCVQNLFCLSRQRRWCNRHSDVKNMADKKFYKCSCGVFFATLEAAVAHKCHGASSVQVIKELPGTSQTDRTTCMFQCYTCKTFFENMDTFNSHQCEDEQLEGKPKGTGNESESDAAVWNRNATLLFLDLYKDFQESVSKGRMKKKALWDKISSKMSLHGYNFTADQVGGRWKSLIRGYKNAKDSNKKSGNGAKQYEYEDELDDILGKDPIMKPKFLLGSQPSSPTSNKVPVTSEEPGTSEPKRTKTPTLDVEDSISDDDSSEPTRKKPKRKLTPTNEVVDVFKTYISDQKEEWKRRETMHKERLAVMTSLIDVLKGTIAKPHDPNNNK